jgi:hypothetical protein
MRGYSKVDDEGSIVKGVSARRLILMFLVLQEDNRMQNGRMLPSFRVLGSRGVSTALMNDGRHPSDNFTPRHLAPFEDYFRLTTIPRPAGRVCSASPIHPPNSMSLRRD